MTSEASAAPVIIRMHERDNVAIVGNDGGLPAGTVLPGAQITQRHLVALRHTLGQHQPAGQNGARRQTAVIANDGHVVALVHANNDRGGAGF